MSAAFLIDREMVRDTIRAARYPQLDDMSMKAIVPNYIDLPVSTGDCLNGKLFNEVVQQHYNEFVEFHNSEGFEFNPKELKDEAWWTVYNNIQDYKKHKGERFCGVIVHNWDTSMVKYVTVWESDWDDFCKTFNYCYNCDTTPRFEVGELPITN